jgi:hypothetical protein
MKRLVIGIALCALTLGACSDDDGGDVRTIDDSGSGSGSGSASGSGPATGSGSATGSSAAAECEPSGDASAATSTVQTTLSEFAIETDVTEAASGLVHFAVSNEGAEPHELVVIMGVAPSDLPLAEDGSLDEAQLPEGALIGEVEPFPGGETCDGTFELAAGDYTLLCNVVETEDDGEIESHVMEGMVTAFTVT